MEAAPKLTFLVPGAFLLFTRLTNARCFPLHPLLCSYSEQMAAFRANPVSESEPESEPELESESEGALQSWLASLRLLAVAGTAW